MNAYGDNISPRKTLTTINVSSIVNFCVGKFAGVRKEKENE